MRRLLAYVALCLLLAATASANGGLSAAGDTSGELDLAMHLIHVCAINPALAYPIASELHALRVNAPNHGSFVSSSAQLLNDLREAGLLTGEEMGSILSGIARSN